MRLLALDPGGTTGWASYTNKKFDSGHLGEYPKFHNAMLRDFLNYEKPDTLICENFKRVTTESAVLVSIEYIGVARMWTQDNGVDFFLSSTGNMAFVTDAKIKKLGLWVPGKVHAMDAMRHLLWYMIFRLNNQEILRALA